MYQNATARNRQTRTRYNFNALLQARQESASEINICEKAHVACDRKNLRNKHLRTQIKIIKKVSKMHADIICQKYAKN